MISGRAMAFGLVLALAAGEVSAQVPAPTAPAAGPAARPGLGRIDAWGYQLQRIDPERVANSPFDLVVVDPSSSGKEQDRFSAADVRRMQARPDGGRRLVLAYLSVGEAEDYRSYWQESWVETVMVQSEPDGALRLPGTGPPDARSDRGTIRLLPLRLPKLGAPGWLGRENERWPSNFLVRYWDPAWQELIFGEGDSLLSRILAAGFDGVFLDRVDAFEAAESARPEARQDMVRLVVALAERARRHKPGFRVVPQNGEQLLADPAYLAAIDAVAKEDLLYGDGTDGQRNAAETVARNMRWLAPAVSRGLPVLVVEYVPDAAVIEELRAEIQGRGFLPYFGERALDRLMLPGDWTPGASTAAPSKALPAPRRAPAEPDAR